jgi:hypothetical protein
MSNKYMKNCSVFLAIKERQIKTTLKFHLILVRLPTIKNKNNNKYWLEYSKTYIVDGNVDLYNHYGKQYGDSLKR